MYLYYKAQVSVSLNMHLSALDWAINDDYKRMNGLWYPRV